MRKIYYSLIFLILFILVFFGTFSFLVNIDLVINEKMVLIQNNVFIFLSKIIDVVFDTISMIVLSLIISVYLFIKKYKREALLFSITNLIAGGIIYTLKEVVQRIRPENALIESSNFSFPSGHATISVVFFILLFYIFFKNSKKILLIFTATILIIGFSRIYVNMHWFSDVIGGYFLGLFLIFLAMSIDEIVCKV